jgi:hypothetical protein
LTFKSSPDINSGVATEQHPVLLSERITFPAGFKPAEIRETCCDKCFFGVACTGPRENGGVVVAEIHDDRSGASDIVEKAECEPRTLLSLL